jgi:hypothetical protein
VCFECFFRDIIIIVMKRTTRVGRGIGEKSAVHMGRKGGRERNAVHFKFQKGTIH